MGKGVLACEPLYPAETKGLVVPVEWKEADDGTMTGYASTFGNVDLVGDRIANGAFKKTIQERVPTGEVKILADHVPTTDNVLGTMVEAREDSTGLWFKAKLSNAEDVASVRTKMREGHINKLSIGYTPRDWEWTKDDEGPVRLLKEIQLFEVSAVVFPANPQAVINEVKAAVNSGGLDGVRQHLQNALSLLDPSSDEKAAIPSHSTSTSTGAWDGPGNESQIPNDAGSSTLRRMYAWVDGSQDADTKAAYKLPHHEVTDGEVGSANVAGCRAAIAALNGARGGTDIPDADRQAVYNHLAAHLRAADVEPPELASADTHLQTADGDAHDSAGPAPAGSPTLRKLRTDALLAGRDPDETVDPVQLAGLDAALEWEAKLLDSHMRER